jgi:Ser/Thr protein kinase RdoA (MazF antagonist)
MEKRIKDRYNDLILQQVMKSYEIQKDDIQLLDGFESFIYEFNRKGSSFILRIGHNLRRSENLIRGEVDWINYLYQGGAGVSQAILAENGDLVIPIEDGSGDFFLATAFEKAHGSPPSKEIMGPAFYKDYGRLLGRMHALTRIYTPKDPTWRRPQWDEPIMLEVLGWLPDSEALVAQRYIELKNYLDQLPKSNESYGLIHFDAHMGNMFVDERGVITLFDFDDCNYSWFINDIAIVLFYIALGVEDQAAFTRKFMTNFLRGYSLENELDHAWLGEIPSFLKLREIDLYAIIHRSFDVENIDHPWVAMYMKDRKELIENGIPFIDFDFTILRIF